jgi:3-hydroxyisobutyrate dehydrogenase-like beta-hydroxyacid dehydrogenase
MSLNLQRAGARLVIFNRSRGILDELAKQGMVAAASPRAVAEQARTTILMVSDTPAVEQVLLGDTGIVNGLRPGDLVIDMGTTAVTPTRRFAEHVRARGADYLDAPVSGGQPGAEAGTLAIMAGGSDEAFERARPLFRVLGENITHVGAVGAGQVAKAANQVIVGLTIGAVAEALALARRAGVDPARVRQALSGGFAASRILEVHGQRMIDGNFRPGAKASIQRKDLTQALELAEQLGLALPSTRLNLELYERLIAGGGENLDHSALYTLLQDGGDEG